ncbi:MFS transporter [Legionella quateirensis]|uniref:Transporter of the major facilitator superfamily (MFS) n=1 Tax=Legionella quateirensis TaxID=45072 RepID=A0A378KV14_9GAMM|nr:MFS transporter [Legionella quateirensis]KTD43674.1 transporter of the major facilitator superfamily (MFS) [Legionella quateirensis]STY17337.1 transporter of the major facilitator superfamily (MFS) [Legionella quateirensis]
MNKKNISLSSLIWVVFVDSMGWGIAFSVFAALFLTDNVSLLPATVSDASRYMIYEFLLAIYSVFMFFFAPVLGGVADRYGRKPGLIISMLGLTFGFILGALGCYFSAIWLLVVGRIISGITAGSLSIAQAATVDISTPQNKAFNLSIVMLANCLGFSLGPVLGDLLLNSSYAPLGTTTFLIGALMSAIGFIGITLFFDETYAPSKKGEKFNFLKDFANIKIAFKKPVLSSYLVSLLFSMVAFGLFFSDIPVFLSRQFSDHASATGTVLSTEAIVFSLTLMFGGKYIFNYLEKTTVVFLTLVLQLCSYLLLSLCIDSFVVNIVLFTCISAFAGLMYIALLTLISDSTESDWQGRVMGVVAALSSVTWGVGPLLTGALNQYGSSFAFVVSGVFIVVGILALRSVKTKNQQLGLVES